MLNNLLKSIFFQKALAFALQKYREYQARKPGY